MARLRPVAPQKQTRPATIPMARDPAGLTKPEAGVMATRPATAPDAAPRLVACPSRSFSTSSQPSIAAAVATWVFMNASAAWPLAARAEPALNPNQPNHSSPAPISTSGRLCGRIESRLKPIRLPRTRQSARPAAPALMWTAVPPAKSSTPLAASQPAPVVSVPPKSKTQWATGK